MAETLVGKNLDEAKELFQCFHKLITEDTVPNGIPRKLAVFSGVKEFPMRVKCATLAWHTVLAALENKDEATTE
jgi:nitrogen fixation NifU-like protein